jgi:hypothetical protein
MRCFLLSHGIRACTAGQANKMKVLVGITVLLAFVAAASASRGASRDLQTMG